MSILQYNESVYAEMWSVWWEMCAAGERRMVPFEGGGEEMKSFTVGATKIKTISPKDYHALIKSSVKQWHFERTDNGVKPVPGEYNPTNPAHVAKNSVVHMRLNGKDILLKE